MFGFLPVVVAGAAGAAGAAFWACASALLDVIAAAATSVDVPSKILRRLMDFASLSRDNGSARPLSFASIRLSVLMWVFEVLAYS
jgi:hypothetical protein